MKKNSRPLVTIVTPTYNRQKFLPWLIRCVEAQTYPKRLLEWLILDDSVEDVTPLFKDVPYARVIRSEKRLTIGEKRNWLNREAQGEIIVCVDDDDYYAPERVSHAVLMLNAHPKYLVAGVNVQPLWFPEQQKLVDMGPYHKNHTTGGFLVYRRQILSRTRFNDNHEKAEERWFLEDYSYAMVHLDRLKTGLMIAHSQNTVTKQQFLMKAQKESGRCRFSGDKIKEFFRSSESAVREFYMSSAI